MSTVYIDLVAAGTLQGDAYAIASGATYAEFKTCVTDAQACQLPGGSGGDVIQIKNNGVAALSVFPQVGGSVNGAATNAADSNTLSTGESTRYTTLDGANWIVIPDGVGQAGGLNKQISHTAADLTLTQGDSGSTLLLTPDGTARIITLPAVKAGLNFRFIQAAAAGAGAMTVKAPGTSTLLQGGVIGAATVVALAGRNQVTFASAAAVMGDRIDMECDGTKWLVRGWGTALGAFTSAS